MTRKLQRVWKNRVESEKNISLSCNFDRSQTVYFVFSIYINTNLKTEQKAKKKLASLESQAKLPKQGRKQTP